MGHIGGSTEDENRRASTAVDNKILTKLKPEEVQLSVSPPKRATGNRMPESVQSFEELTGQIHLTQLCEKTFFQYLVAAKKKYKIRPNAGDGWRTITPLCREYSSSRSYPKVQALAAIPKESLLDQSWK